MGTKKTGLALEKQLFSTWINNSPGIAQLPEIDLQEQQVGLHSLVRPGLDICNTALLEPTW